MTKKIVLRTSWKETKVNAVVLTPVDSNDHSSGSRGKNLNLQGMSAEKMEWRHGKIYTYICNTVLENNGQERHRKTEKDECE